MNNNRSIIKMKNIIKYYTKERTILNQLNLTVPLGDYISIVGESGSGKTTLLNIIGLLDTVNSGDYFLDGTNILKLNSAQRSKLRNKMLGFVFQSYNLIARTTVYDNIILPFLYSDVRLNPERKEYVDFLLEQFKMKDLRDSYVDDLSGGEKQRVSFVRALVLGANIIIADEPTGNLDPINTDIILDVFDQLSKESKTIIVVTHDSKVAKRAKTKYQLVDGKLIRYD